MSHSQCYRARSPSVKLLSFSSESSQFGAVVVGGTLSDRSSITTQTFKVRSIVLLLRLRRSTLSETHNGPHLRIQVPEKNRGKSMGRRAIANPHNQPHLQSRAFDVKNMFFAKKPRSRTGVDAMHNQPHHELCSLVTAPVCFFPSLHN